MWRALPGGIKKKGGILAVFAVLTVLAFAIGPGLASSFDAQENNQPTFVASTLRTLNISVANTNATNNISRVVISFEPSQFVYINGTNETTAFNTNFTIEYNTVAPLTFVRNLSWSNNSLQGIINASQTAYFSFKAILPSSAGTYNITVYTYHNISPSVLEINSTNVTFTVSGLSSTGGNFSSHHGEAFFNWTDGNLTIESNENGTQFYVENKITNITPHYFTVASIGAYYSGGLYLTASEYNTCFEDSQMEFVVLNSTVNAENTSTIINETQTFFFSPRINDFCPPGIYKGTFAVRNLSNSSERMHVPATINIPININNTFTEANNTGFFAGSNSSGGDHKYYFFTNLTQNITGVTINVSALSSDVDLFLLNSSGILLDKSISNGGGTEEVFQFLPATGDIWEIRLANVISSYTGFLYFTTLNVTTTDASAPLRNLTFGTLPLNPNETNTTDFRLENIDVQDAANVMQSFEIYRSEEFKNYSTPSTFYVLVPNYATKLKVRLSWENESNNVTDWDLFLRDNTGRFIANSTNKSAVANSTNLVREEYITYTGPFNTSYEGLWNITVINQTNKTNFFNVTALIYFDEDEWINSGFNQSTDFNTTGASNSSYNITANLTIPRTDILNGTYAGIIKYYNNSGWVLELPFSFQLQAGHLLINKTMHNSTVVAKENVGFNRSVSINVSYNNTGGLPVYFTNTTPGLAVMLVGGSVIANFTVQSVPNPLNPTVSGIFNISIPTNASHINGIYQGWMLFNSTNFTSLNSSYPHRILNLTMNVNMTDRLNATVTTINTGHTANMHMVDNTSKKTNVTFTVDVRLQNQTQISQTTTMGLANFTSGTMTEMNTSASTALTGKTTATTGGNACSSAKTCTINFTVPANMVGGRYRAEIPVQWNTSAMWGTGSMLYATATNTTFLINNTGINMSAPSTVALGNVNELTSTYLNVTVGNLGPLDALSVGVTLNAGSCPITITRETSSPFGTGCTTISSGTSGATHTATVSKFTPINGGCALRWKILGNNISADTGCTITVTANRASHNNITGISMTIKNVAASTTTSTSSSSSSSSTTTTCTLNSQCSSTKYCSGGTCTSLSCKSHEYISDHTCVAYAPNIASYEEKLSVMFGETVSTTIKVNESNNMTISASLSVTMDDVTATVTPAKCYTPCNFTVNISTKNSTNIKIYTGTLKVYHHDLPAAYQTKSFSLAVNPTEEKKREISSSYESYLSVIEGVKQKFEAMKPFLSQGNLTLLQSLVDRMNNLSVDIQGKLTAGDYIAANALISEINSTISQIQSRFSELEDGNIVEFGVMWWVIVGIVLVGVIIFVVYLLLPPKIGYPSSFKPNNRGIGSIIKGLFKKKKKPTSAKITSYAKGYKKNKAFVYKKKKNTLKKLFKRKNQKKLGEFSI